MNQYKGHDIIRQGTARLVPPEPSYPDCMCKLILTEGYLYVLEDNYDETYTEHFAIPAAKIRDMTLLLSDSDERDLSPGVNMAVFLLGLLGGLLVFIQGRANTKASRKYLRINYFDSQAEKKDVYFIELDGKIKKLADYWKSKIKRRE